MTRARGIDQHLAAVRALDGRLVDLPTLATWCPIHPTQKTPCTACAGDHKAGEHHSTVPIPSCRHCRPTPAPSIDAPALAARNEA
jgi:hypothetical protein